MPATKPVLKTLGDGLDALPPVYPERVPQVYAAMVAVMKAIGAQGGITKDHKNVEQKYSFRGIDDVYNALNDLLAQHNLIVLPRVLEDSFIERGKTKNGTAVFSSRLKVEFTFTYALDGSQAVAVTMGEGMDMSDKATNKASSAAYKYAMLQVFCIPTDGLTDDADRETIEVDSRRDDARDEPAKPLSKREDGRELYDRLSKANRALQTTDQFNAFWNKASVVEALQYLPKDWRRNIDDEKRDKSAEIYERESRAAEPLDDDTFPGDLPMNEPNHTNGADNGQRQ